MEGILPRIVHKVSTLIGGDSVSDKLQTVPRPWGWRQGMQTRFFLAHWRGGGHTQPWGLKTQWSGHKPKRCHLGDSHGRALNKPGHPVAPPTGGTRFGNRTAHTAPQGPGQGLTGRSQQPPTADMRTSGQGMRSHLKITGQVSWS